MKALEPIDVILEGKDATSVWQFWNADEPMVVNGIALILVMVMRFEQSLNAESPIVASWLVGFRSTRIKLVRPRNADAPIDVVLSGRVRNWIGVIIALNVVGIVVIVLVFWKMMVLKDGQLMALTSRYEMLDTSRFSVVNLGRVLNTPLTLSVVMEGDIVKEDSLDPLNVPGRIVVSVLLRDKSKEPERFVQELNARVPSVLNDIGAKVSTPVPLQFWKARASITVIPEEKDATSLLQFTNASKPIDVRFWVLKILCMPALENALLGIAVNPDTSNEPEILQFWNEDDPSDVKNNVGQTNPVPEPPHSKNAAAPTALIVEGRVPARLEHWRNPFIPMVVNGIALRFVMVVRFVHPLNALVPIVASWLVGFRSTRIKLVRPRNADPEIVVALSGRVRNWIGVIIALNVVGIVVIVLVFWKMMVLKDGQLTALTSRYDTLDTSRYSVVNLGRFLNTSAGDSVVMEGDNVKEDSLEEVNVTF